VVVGVVEEVLVGVVVVEVLLDVPPMGVVVLLAGWPMVPVLPPLIICSVIGS
jgi:hypothetical protein